MVLSTIPLNVAFQRSLVGVNLHSWHVVVVRASPADYLNPLPILYLGSREQKNTLQQTTYLSTYFCWPNKFPLPLPRFVGPTNMPTYSLPRSSLSRTRTHATPPHRSTAALQPSPARRPAPRRHSSSSPLLQHCSSRWRTGALPPPRLAPRCGRLLRLQGAPPAPLSSQWRESGSRSLRRCTTAAALSGNCTRDGLSSDGA